MIYRFFDKKTQGSGANNKIEQNEQLAEELHKLIIRKCKRIKVCSSFKNDIWGANLTDVQLLSKRNKRIRFLLCVADTFSKYSWVLRTLKNKIYKHMIAVSKNMYIDKLDHIVNKYNNTCQRTIKIKPTDVKDNAYIDSIKEVDNKDPKFQVGDHVRISKYKKCFAK